MNAGAVVSFEDTFPRLVQWLNHMQLIMAATDRGLGVVLQTLNFEQQLKKKNNNLIKSLFSHLFKNTQLSNLLGIIKKWDSQILE